MSETLGSRLASLDARRFVGRSDELARLEALLEPQRATSVVLLHGAAGVGKSALLRELARRARTRGYSVVEVEARDLAPIAAEVDAATAAALRPGPTLLTLDSWERLSALDVHLRRELIPRLPVDTLVVIASRRPPSSAWASGGWEHLVLDLPLAPLGPAESDALLRAYGVDDAGTRAEVIAWSGGSPLALVLAGADSHGSGDVPAPGSRRIVERLLRRLLESGTDDRYHDVLAVAALARVTTADLLRDVLPAIDASAAFDWLRSHPAAEPLRDGVTLHDLVGRALRADLRRRVPELERDLRRRLIDALYARCTTGGNFQMTLDLQHLVQDPAIRWGFSWDTSGRLRIDAPRAGDLDAIAALGSKSARAWLDDVSDWFEVSPDRVTVIRDLDDAIAGYGVSVTPHNAPAAALEDPILAARVRHAGDHVPDGAAVIWRQAIDLTRDATSPVIAQIGLAGIVNSGLVNPAAAYLPVVRGDDAARAFADACGAVAVPELAVELHDLTIECRVINYGPGGLLAFQRTAVYRELGLPAPAPPPTLADLREALRNYHSPALLADGPFAPPTGTKADRGAAARRRLDHGIATAFGSSPQDKLLRSVLELAYIDPAPSHELAADELHFSRASYFRKLREAVERVAVQLGIA